MKRSIVRQRATLPYQIQDLQDFYQAIGIENIEKGHNTMSGKKWKAHQKKYGTNSLKRESNRFRWRYSNMPFYYAFLTLIAVGVTVADKLLYEYDYWYI